jgi:hypothetical protein
MIRRRSLLFGVCAGLLAGALTVAWAAAQHDPCDGGRLSVSGPIDVTNLPVVKNLNRCTRQLTLTEDALPPTPGPYIDRGEAERIAIAGNNPTKVRSFLVTVAEAHQMLGSGGASTDVHPDRMVWLVVVQAPNQGAKPSLMPGVKPWPRRFYFVVLDAATGRALWGGGNEANSGDWPAGVPAD